MIIFSKGTYYKPITNKAIHDRVYVCYQCTEIHKVFKDEKLVFKEGPIMLIRVFRVDGKLVQGVKTFTSVEDYQTHRNNNATHIRRR